MTAPLLHITRDGGSQRMSVPREQLRRLRLAVHGLLRAVPLHDVTVVDLPGGGAERTIADVRALLAREHVRAENPSCAASSRCVPCWDGCVAGTLTGTCTRRRCLSIGSAATSHVVRLCPRCTDRSVSCTCGRESLAEMRNATVHACLVSVLTETPCGYRLYGAVDV